MRSFQVRLVKFTGWVWLLVGFTACSQGDDAARIARVERGVLPLVTAQGALGVTSDIEQRMDYYGVPGVSVAVIEDGQVAWAKGYGTVRENGDQAVDVDTLFQAASISKPVTAVAALSLVAEGKLDLDEDVNQRLISWKVPENQYTRERKVTLRRLLNHSAGVSVHGFLGYLADDVLPSVVNILDGVAPANTAPIEVDAPVDSTWRYSGGGYMIVQQLLEDVSGTLFPQVVAESVLRPMGMEHSTFEQPLPEAWAPNAATGHYPGLGPVVGGYKVFPEMAAAGLWTTAKDLARFAIGVHQAAVGDSDRVIDESLANEMLTARQGDFGLGVEVYGSGQAMRFGHSGINDGFDSMLVAYPKLGNGAVVMTNSNMSFGLINEIIDSIAREYKWPRYPTGSQQENQPFTATQLEQYPGDYDFGGGFAVSVVRDNDRLFLSVLGQVSYGRTEIYQTASGGSFFVVGLGLPPFDFISDETGTRLEVLPPPENSD